MSDATRHQDTEFDPRHRVVGAIILVLVAVIFLPMLLERDVETGEVTGSDIEQAAAQEDKVFVSTITPLEQAPDGSVTVLPPAAQPAPENTGPAAKAPATVAPPAPEPEPKSPPPAATAAAQESGEVWLVRIGTFSHNENAQRVLDDLKAKGFKPETGATDTGKGEATRVWLGPFPSRDSAVSARSRVLKETGYEGLVVPAP